MEIRARNVNDALSNAIWRLKCGNFEPEKSRNGKVIAFPEPVMTIYERPEERVIFSPRRDANPIFHILEGIWMLAGRKDVGFLSLFNSTINQFSDDGENFNAAYGARWRSYFGQDQLLRVIEMLRANPSTRQAVLQMWSPDDLTKKTKDKACNMAVVFDCRYESLNMTVFNRSNDLWFGAYGANAVHFSFLQEFVARSVGMSVGVYNQMSHNLHLYMSNGYDGKAIIRDVMQFDDCNHYKGGVVRPMPIMENDDYKSFLRDCEVFCNDPFNMSTKYFNSFFFLVARPMALISKVRREKSGTGEYWANLIMASDWKRAALEWIERREIAKQK